MRKYSDKYIRLLKTRATHSNRMLLDAETNLFRATNERDKLRQRVLTLEAYIKEVLFINESRRMGWVV